MKNLIHFTVAAGFIVCAWASISSAAVPNSGLRVCEILLNSKVAAEPMDKLGLSQIQRIDRVLEGLSESQKSELFQTLAQSNLSELALKIRTGKAPEMAKLIESQPALLNIFMDLVEFGDAFPGVFGLSNATETVARVLDLSRQQELATDLKNPDILKAQAEAPRLARTIDNTLINLIEQATMEYDGMKFGRTGWNYIAYRLKRFFLPTHNRVRDLVDWSQTMQKQLSRLKIIDGLVIRQGLSEARAEKLNDEEVTRLLKFVLNSPEEIDQIEKLVRKVLGKTFANGRSVEIGQFDVYQSDNKMESVNTEKTLVGFDHLNITSLDELDSVLNAARSRRGVGPRSVKDYSPVEVQLRFEAGERQISRTREMYLSITNLTSNVSYTVERQRTRQVPDGVDDKGRPKTRTEVYYVSDTVEPSFEDILSDSFDTGDRFVSGLDRVKSDAAQVVKREAAARNRMAKVEEFIGELATNWYEKVMKGEAKTALGSGQKNLAAIQELLAGQIAYAQLPTAQIKVQYAYDSAENFRGRNQMMVERLRQAEATLIAMNEALIRQLPSLYPFYDLFDYSNWLYTLRGHRNSNYRIKAAMVTTTGVGSYVGLSKDAQAFLAAHGIDIAGWFDQVLRMF